MCALGIKIKAKKDMLFSLFLKDLIIKKGIWSISHQTSLLGLKVLLKLNKRKIKTFIDVFLRYKYIYIFDT